MEEEELEYEDCPTCGLKTGYGQCHYCYLIEKNIDHYLTSDLGKKRIKEALTRALMIHH